MGEGKLGWDWFDPLKCWEAIQELWLEGGVRNHLMHSGWTKTTTTGGGDDGGSSNELDRSGEGERFCPSFPCNSKLCSQFRC